MAARPNCSQTSLTALCMHALLLKWGVGSEHYRYGFWLVLMYVHTAVSVSWKGRSKYCSYGSFHGMFDLKQSIVHLHMFPCCIYTYVHAMLCCNMYCCIPLLLVNPQWITIRSNTEMIEIVCPFPLLFSAVVCHAASFQTLWR